MKKFQSPHQHRQGSTLMVVMMLMFILSLVAASLLTLGTHEKDLTFRRIADVEGRHALESAIEIAMAELENHFKTVQSVTATTPLIELSNPVRDQLVQQTRYLSDVRIVSVTNEMLRQRIFIDHEDPDSLLDPHRGSYVTISEWTVVAEVDVNYRGRTRQMQAAQTFQVRESPFFTHAIFYNMDLEFHPGAPMEIEGPVHTNSNLWLMAGDNLHFFDRVSATRNIFTGPMVERPSGTPPWQENWSTMSGDLSYDNRSRQHAGHVWFNTDGRNLGSGLRRRHRNIEFGNLRNLNYTNLQESRSYFDSRSEESGALFQYTGFLSLSEFLAYRFNGFLTVGSAEAPAFLPAFMPPYAPDDGNGHVLNHGYALIEPLQPARLNGQPNPFHKGNGERNKFAYKAGISFRIFYSELPVTPENFPDWDEQAFEGITRLVRTGMDRFDEDGDLIEENLSDFYMIATRIRRGNAHVLDTTDYSASAIIPVLDENNNPVLDEFDEPVTFTIPQTSADRVHIQPQVVDRFLTMRLYEEHLIGSNRGNPKANSSLYDPRRQRPTDTVVWDMEAFDHEFVEIESAEDLERFHDPDGIVTFTPRDHFNGVVYVEFPTPANPPTRPDHIVVAQDEFRPVQLRRNNATVTENAALALWITNASRIPNPSYNLNRSPGFTIATNGKVYIHGHYNADGIVSTFEPASSNDEDPEFNVLAAIAADSVSFLSAATSDTDTRGFRAENSRRSRDDRPATFTEINAAIMSGIVPSNKPISWRESQSVQSGGAHNYHRFLENWAGQIFRYRGSQVSFFESEIGREPLHLSYYGAPRRQYSFFEDFKSEQPPGTPWSRTFFKVDFRFL